jgi:hypothetical protein
MQTTESENRGGNECLEARENDLVELILFATECTEDEWELADLVEAWVLEGEGSERLCPPLPRSTPSPHSAPSPAGQSRPTPVRYETQRSEPEIQLQTEAA